MAEEDQQTPKIIVDDDWKAQAQAEKEKLAKDAEAKAEAPPGQGAAGGEGGPRELPPASFSVLVSSLVTQIFFSLGAVEDPRTKKRYIDLDMARHHIDMLKVLEEKSQNNLSEEEKKLLDRATYEARMQYVQVAQQMSQAAGGGAGQVAPR